MAARAYWQGRIRLALVSSPIEIHPAIPSGATIRFHQVHEPSGKRSRYEKVAPGIDPVDRDEIVEGYEISRGNYVLLEDEEIEAAKVESKKSLGDEKKGPAKKPAARSTRGTAMRTRA